ncbi:MAG: VOC family protein [Gemmatimonadota bacterium]
MTPYLFADRADELLDFLVHGLGGIEILRHMNGDRVANAQIVIGTSTVMVSEASAEFPAMPGSYYVYVENADESVARAVAAGATQIMAVSDMPYDDRQGGVRDPCGNIWWVSQRLTDGPY